MTATASKPRPLDRLKVEGQLGMQIVAGTPERIRVFVDGEMAKWSKIIRENVIKLE